MADRTVEIGGTYETVAAAASGLTNGTIYVSDAGGSTITETVGTTLGYNVDLKPHPNNVGPVTIDWSGATGGLTIGSNNYTYVEGALVLGGRTTRGLILKGGTFARLVTFGTNTSRLWDVELENIDEDGIYQNGGIIARVLLRNTGASGYGIHSDDGSRYTILVIGGSKGIRMRQSETCTNCGVARTTSYGYVLDMNSSTASKSWAFDMPIGYLCSGYQSEVVDSWAAECSTAAVRVTGSGAKITRLRDLEYLKLTCDGEDPGGDGLIPGDPVTGSGWSGTVISVSGTLVTVLVDPSVKDTAVVTNGTTFDNTGGDGPWTIDEFDALTSTTEEDMAFVDPDGEDYRHYPYSVLADALSSGMTPDLDGVDRPVGDDHDGGPYECAMMVITHTPIEDGQEVGEDVLVEAVIEDHDGIDEASVFYRTRGDTEWTEVGMDVDGDNYSATIPSVSTPGVEYYIWALDSSALAEEGTDPSDAPTSYYSFKVVSGIEAVSVEDSRTLRVRFRSAPGRSGPRRAMRRQAYTVSQLGVERLVGRPYIDEDNPNDILVPVDRPWADRSDITVTVDARDAAGGAYSSPATATCPGVPEVTARDGSVEASRPRDDLHTNRLTEEMLYSAGTYRHHWGNDQLLKVASRVILESGPFGIGVRLDVPSSRNEVERLRSALRDRLSQQPGVKRVVVTVSTVDRDEGVIYFRVVMLTPQGWVDKELPLNLSEV